MRVFISYKWEDTAHNKWVEKFASDLRASGLNVILDKWSVRYGDSLTDYMTSMIGKADVVIFIMTQKSIKAVESSTSGGGVKFEMQLAMSRKIAGERMRLIPIYREGSKVAERLRDFKYADFRADTNYEANLKDLVEDLASNTKNVPDSHHSDILDILRTAKVLDLWDKVRKVRTIDELETIGAFRKFFAETDQLYFPVVDKNNHLVGIFGINDIRGIMNDKDISDLVVMKDLATPHILFVTPKSDLETVFTIFADRKTRLRSIPVVTDDDNRVLVGMLDQGEVIAYLHEQMRRLNIRVKKKGLFRKLSGFWFE